MIGQTNVINKESIPTLLGPSYEFDFDNLSNLDTGMYIISSFTLNMPPFSGSIHLLEVETTDSTDIYKQFTITFGPDVAVRQYDTVNHEWSDWEIFKQTYYQATLTLIDTNWTPLSSSYPFTWQQTINNPFTYVPVNEVELINNNAVLFAQHGFAISSYTDTSITIIAVEKPSDSVNLIVRYK